QEEYIAHFRYGEPPSQSVEDHLLGTAALARQYAAVVDLGDMGELLGLLHDWGKYSGSFQQYIKSSSGFLDQDSDDDGSSIIGKTKKPLPMKGKIDHSTAGAQFVWKKPNYDGPDWIKKVFAEMTALIIAGHHGGLMDISSDGDDLLAIRMNKDDEKTHLTEIEPKISPQVSARVDELLCSDLMFLTLEELILEIKKTEDDITAESIEKLGQTGDESSMRLSREQIKTAGKARLWFAMGCLTKLLFSVLVDADRCDTVDFCVDKAAETRQNSNYTEWSVMSERLERYLSCFSTDGAVNKIRRNISDRCLEVAQKGRRGIFTLTVPTGGGKTLASMRFAIELAKCSLHDAHPIERIIYVIPYTTIIDQNAAKAREVLETDADRGRIVLECHSNLLEENETWEGKLLSENWDAPVVFTTNVQFLESLFSGGTKNIRRMHQLAHSVIIFDEIQTLPIKTVHLFCGALNFLVEHCGTTALLCTATQPLLNGVSKDYGALRYGAENEIIPNASELFEALKRVEIENCVKPGGYSINELSDMVIEKQGVHRSALAIVNTTTVARKLYGDIRAKLEAEAEIKVVHLSAQMCPAHRKVVLDNINALLKAGAPLICVSTQVMEAGVDVDFGCGIRSLAGFDSMVQAAGRCNREGRNKKIAPLFIVNPVDEKIDKLVDIKEGRRVAERILNECSSTTIETPSDILSLENISRYFRYYFYARHEEMRYNVNTADRDDNLFNLLSLNAKTKTPPARKLRQAFATAGNLFNVIEAPTKGVIVQYGEGKELVDQLTVNTDSAEVKKLLHRSQRFSVNVYPYQLDALVKSGGVYKQSICGASGAEVWILAAEFYSDEFGLSTEQVGKLKLEVT
ncbi:MAG: CRISPR-associated helicase Cas3', partial [Cloacibacillus sp.]